ncbi:hypothetical protein AAE478_008358 [Parahypoxylon ruwenzoriense]
MKNFSGIINNLAMPASRSSDVKDRQKWTAEQDAILISAVAKVSSKSGDISWHQVANHLPGRTNKDCRKRWYYKIAHNFRKGPWSAEEDQRLRDAVRKHGTKWNKVSGEVSTRNGDQCWKRWNDSLNPSIDHSPWDTNEDSVLIKAVEAMGRNWSDIVNQFLPGRTALAAKNRYSLLRRRIENAEVGPKGDSNGDASPSPSPSPSTPSLGTEDNNFDFMDVNSGALSINFDSGQDTTGYLDSPDLESDIILSLSNPQNSQLLDETAYPTPSSTLTASSYGHSEYNDMPGFTMDNDIDYLGSLADLGNTEHPLDGQLLADNSTKELTIRAKCRSDRTEMVMEGLTKLVNNLMVQGDVKDVNFSIA